MPCPCSQSSLVLQAMTMTWSVHARYSVERLGNLASAISIITISSYIPRARGTSGTFRRPSRRPSRAKRSKASIASSEGPSPRTRQTDEMAATRCLGRCLSVSVAFVARTVCRLQHHAQHVTLARQTSVPLQVPFRQLSGPREMLPPFRL